MSSAVSNAPMISPESSLIGVPVYLIGTSFPEEVCQTFSSSMVFPVSIALQGAHFPVLQSSVLNKS